MTLLDLQSRIVRKPNGSALRADEDSKLWLQIRFESVTATDINRMTLQDGSKGVQFFQILSTKLEQDPGPRFAAYDLGIEREPAIAQIVTELFPENEFHHNKFLFAGDDFRHVATPDLVGNDAVGEIKVSTKPLAKIRNRYLDQMQWQMHVTGLERALFIVENRFTQHLETQWIKRDQRRIDDLEKVASDFLEMLDAESQR